MSDVQRPLLYELSASDVFAELVLVGLAPPVRMSELVHHVPLGALAPLVGHGQRSAQHLFFFLSLFHFMTRASFKLLSGFNI